MTIENIWIDQQTISQATSGIYLFKKVKLFDKCSLCFGATVQEIDNTNYWFRKDQTHLKEFYLTIYCKLSVTISNTRPREDEGIDIITKSSFIYIGDFDDNFDESTLKILAQLYGTSANYCFSNFAYSRKHLGMTERIPWLTPQDILVSLNKKEYDLPTFLNTLHHF